MCELKHKVSHKLIEGRGSRDESGIGKQTEKMVCRHLSYNGENNLNSYEGMRAKAQINQRKAQRIFGGYVGNFTTLFDHLGIFGGNAFSALHSTLV